MNSKEPEKRKSSCFNSNWDVEMIKKLKGDGASKFLRSTDLSYPRSLPSNSVAHLGNPVPPSAFLCHRTSSHDSKSKSQSISLGKIETNESRRSTSRPRSLATAKQNQMALTSEERTTNNLGIKGGLITHEQKIAEKSRKEKIARKNQFLSPRPQSNGKEQSKSYQTAAVTTKVLKPTEKNMFRDNWDTESFHKKMLALDVRAQKLKKELTVERRPHQQVAPAKPMTAQLKKGVNYSKSASKLPEKGANRLDVLSDRFQNRPTGNPNFIAFSSLSDDPWSEISGITSGANILVLMKTMRLGLWDVLKKYYGIFQRLGRLDRAILFELARSALESASDHSPYQNMVKNLDSDPDDAQFYLGKIMMSVYRGIVTADGTLSPRELTMPEIMNRLDDGHKAVLKKIKIRYHLRKSVEETVTHK